MLQGIEVKGHEINAQLVKEACDLAIAEGAGGDQVFFTAVLEKLEKRERPGAGSELAEPLLADSAAA